VSTTYTWALKTIRKTDQSDLQGVIVQTHWTCTGTDTAGNEGVFSGATPFNPQEIDPNNFTAYEDLTEAQVLGWIQAVVVGDYWAHVQAQIAKQIDAKKNPVEEVAEGSFPWSQPADDEDEDEAA
jgi:hypothetical protein